jgi:hypothetical protein
MKLAVSILAAGIMATTLSASASEGGILSPAEKTLITKRIATLHAPEDRHMAEGWSEAKSAAEFLCRPAALPVLRRSLKGADRVFLGTDQPDTLHLENAQLLTGSGSVRYSGGWRDFTFECRLNDATGRVKSFNVELKS